MVAPTIVDLDDEQRSVVRDRLDRALGRRFASEVGWERAQVHNGSLVVPVAPHTYPDSLYPFFEALATAEIELRDGGLAVQLVPDIRQKLLVVACRPDQRPLAYLSRDGEEETDLGAIMGCQGADIEWVRYDAFAYDSSEEYAEVLAAAERKHPDADFGRVHPPRAA